MKESPQTKKLEEILRSSKLVSGGFMGDDLRGLPEIIDTDTSEVSRLGYTAGQLGSRMQEITNTAIAGLGNWVKIDRHREAKVDEAKGQLVCPWPHPGRFAKRVTTLKLVEPGETVTWSDLNIHLIVEHSFFEGYGSAFRVEPRELVRLIF
ncbi:MAG: hypothetical protein ABII09_09290 [Planctomycetota bacterium]